jgi:hypothetical protein
MAVTSGVRTRSRAWPRISTLPATRSAVRQVASASSSLTATGSEACWKKAGSVRQTSRPAL